MMEEIKVDGEVIGTYLDAYIDITGDEGSIPVHCICGRGEACDAFKKSDWSAGMFCEECEHLVEMTGAQADQIISEHDSGEAVDTDYSLNDWMAMLKKRKG